MTRPRIHCAIYTRKSCDEGLEQDFNSLDAQRAACEAFVLSQAGEGWTAIATRYDDGGVSGGTMERPALQHLLDDVSSERVDVIVVYKIDRLTRSLPDFARMVEIFDRHGVSFVSVTQAFNTTTSMGRLTLNVLLSFAQFEREVTGERIRDKIAASKARGMWMGGNLPFGYDLPKDGTRRLVVNEAEAETVRGIFRRYLDLGSVHDLARDLDARGIRSKGRVGKDGSEIAGRPFSRGALFHLLRNPVYLGLIRHKDALHDGLHDAIVDRDLFDAVQARLAASARSGTGATSAARSRGRLTGRIFDATGERMSPTFAIGARGTRYRYYVSASLQRGAKHPSDNVLRRVPADFLEQALIDRLQRIAGIDAEVPLKAVRRVDVFANQVWITLPKSVAKDAMTRLAEGEDLVEDPTSADSVRLQIPISFPKRGGATRGGGETGIRTLETVSRLHTFQACAFDHSATSPAGVRIAQRAGCVQGLKCATSTQNMRNDATKGKWSDTSRRNFSRPMPSVQCIGNRLRLPLM
jgi:site-specific DNA recombinase